nr:hypothetical protein [Tanacetum cinerariifolium]
GSFELLRDKFLRKQAGVAGFGARRSFPGIRNQWVHKNQGAGLHHDPLVGIRQDALRIAQQLYLIEVPPHVREGNGLCYLPNAQLGGGAAHGYEVGGNHRHIEQFFERRLVEGDDADFAT